MYKVERVLAALVHLGIHKFINWKESRDLKVEVGEGEAAGSVVHNVYPRGENEEDQTDSIVQIMAALADSDQYEGAIVNGKGKAQRLELGPFSMRGEEVIKAAEKLESDGEEFALLKSWFKAPATAMLQ